MKAYLIDPEAKTVTEIETTGKFEGPGGFYEFIGTDIIEYAYLPNGDIVAVDEEGLLKTPRAPAFYLRGQQGLVGKAIVCGQQDGEEGMENAEPQTTLEWLQNNIAWEL